MRKLRDKKHMTEFDVADVAALWPEAFGFRMRPSRSCRLRILSHHTSNKDGTEKLGCQRGQTDRTH